MSSRLLSSLPLPAAILSALTRGGYETVLDLYDSSPEALAQDLNISLSASQTVFATLRTPGAPTTFPPLTQSAASMVTRSQIFSTLCPPVDKLLSGGLSRGHILEISGPPGTPKETLAVNIVKSFVEANEEVLFVDAQNMTSPASLSKVFRKSPSVPPNYQRLLYHTNVHTLTDLMIFIHNLSSFLDAHPKTALLVLNSISFPFQSPPGLSFSAKAALLERIKQALTKACASRNLSVVTTSQLATKLLNADGSPGNFETGAKGVMVPQLGSAYLPSGRTHRIIIIPESRKAGVVRLLSSPTYQPGRGSPPQEPYTVV